MNRPSFAFFLVLLMLAPAPAYAIIPSTLGPLQALLVVLPQLLLALGAALLALLKPRTYRLILEYLWAHKGLSALLLAVVAIVLWAPLSASAPPERQGRSWTAFRGGPDRTGALDAPTAIGRPFLRWRYTGGGAAISIDSSPAAVGNRLYFGVSRPSVFSPTGEISCVDGSTGRLVWTWSGERLRPVFSSPAVEVGPDGRARRLVCGEGYHVDRDCRILCLDLEPEQPKLKWAVPTTSHVESSPCLYDGKVYIGAGDDGFWCVDLETGRVVWRIEGSPFYEIGEGREKISGPRVTAIGTARRVNTSEEDEVGRLVLDVREVGDVPCRPGERRVTGRVVAGAGTRIEVEGFAPDVESSPAAAQGRVVFGSGIGGNAVLCADAATGAILWKTSVPFPAFGSPTIDADRVLIGLGNGNFVFSDPNPAGMVVCLSLADGRELWRLALPDTILGSIPARAGRGYVACRDGALRSIDLSTGRIESTFQAGAPLTCSPALAGGAAYLTSTSGKAMAVDLRQLSLLWSLPLTPGSPIYSSPVATPWGIATGTPRGLYCLEGAPAVEPPPIVRPWSGPGGDAGRSGVSDQARIYSLVGPSVGERFAPVPGPVRGPVIGCAGRIFAARDALACVDASTGRLLWEKNISARGMVADPRRVYAATDRGVLALRADTGETAWTSEPPGTLALGGSLFALSADGTLRALDPANGTLLWSRRIGEGFAPAAAHDLLLAARRDRLMCLDDSTGALLWHADARPAGPASVCGGLVYLPCERSVECRRLIDGNLVWRQPLADDPCSYVAASNDWVAVALRSGGIALLRAADGGGSEVVPVGDGVSAPAILKDWLVVAADDRLGAYDLFSSEWRWSFARQDSLGAVSSPPVLARDTLWLGTSRGLFSVRPGELLGSER
jgi:outer membrane protein assembly factor BamB